MTLKKRIIAAAAAAAAIAGIAGAAPAAAQTEAPTKYVHNAMKIALWPDWEQGQSFCSIGAVGTDKYGNEVAVTAGHCWVDDMNYEGQNLDNTNLSTEVSRMLPVYDAEDLDWDPTRAGSDPIAYLRFYKDTDGAGAGHVGKDYAILELAENVDGSSQGPHINMVGINELPNGQINSPYATLPALPQEKVFGSGIFSNNQLIVSGQLGVYYGRITNNSYTGTVGVYQSHAAHEAGDSGGPAAALAPGASYPSAANNYQVDGLWAGITKAKVISYPPYTYTSSANILADLRTRDIATNSDGSVFGAGFQVAKYNHITGVTLP